MDLWVTIALLYIAWIAYALVGIVIVARSDGDMDAASAWLILATAPVSVTIILCIVNYKLIKEWIQGIKTW